MDALYLQEKHDAWSTLIEDTVPLSVRRIQISGKSRAWRSWMLTGGLVSAVFIVVGVLLVMASAVVNSSWACTEQVECLWRIYHVARTNASVTMVKVS